MGTLSSKHKEIIFPHKFIFVFVSHFIGLMLIKTVVKSGGGGGEGVEKRESFPYRVKSSLAKAGESSNLQETVIVKHKT